MTEKAQARLTVEKDIMSGTVPVYGFLLVNEAMKTDHPVC